MFTFLTRKKDKMVFICTAPFDQAQTGDVDYAHSICNGLNSLGVTCKHIKSRALKAEQIVAEIKQAQLQNSTVFHLFMNGDDTFKVTTGGTIKPEHLRDLKDFGVTIFITCIEYAKWSIAEQPQVIKNWDFYFEHADQICFLEDNDLQSAKIHSTLIGEYERESKVQIIPLPSTLAGLNFSQLKPFAERGPHFLCFGMIRLDKGIEKVVIPLAKELRKRNSDRKVLVVGSITSKRHAWDILAEMLIQAYGDSEVEQYIAELKSLHLERVEMTERLLSFYYEKLQSTTPNINIEFYFNVEEHELAALFNQCRYAFNFNSKGLSTHLTGVTNTLMAGMKNYGFDLYLTPLFFKAGGMYERLARAFLLEHDYQDETIYTETEIAWLADEILADIAQLESDPNWPTEFKILLAQFTRNNPLDIQAISKAFNDLYTQTIQDNALTSQRTLRISA